MNQLEHRQLINERNLDKKFYFQSLLGEACEKHLLDDTQIQKIQLELFELMAKQVERYTNDESSSIRVEKAQQLLQSISYCIGVYLKSIHESNRKVDFLKDENISVLFYHGMDVINLSLTKAKSMLANLQKESLKVDNYAYHDTLFTGILEFFHDYDIEYGAHEIPGTIDYPLCNAVSDLLGVEYIYEYLEHFTFENNLCKKFSEDRIQMLLRGYSSESEHVLVNIFELVLTNALGCEMSGQSITKLSLNEKDLALLQNKLEHYNFEELRLKLNIALEHIATEIILEEKVLAYAKDAILRIAMRLEQNLKTRTLIKIWLPLLNPKKREEAFFEDGYQMEDDKLRDLIEEIKVCRYTSDKIAIIQKKVQSLIDLTELLAECFFDEEVEEVFKLLNASEITYLSKFIINETEYDDLEGRNTRKEWQNKLLEYRKPKK